MPLAFLFLVIHFGYDSFSFTTRDSLKIDSKYAKQAILTFCCNHNNLRTINVLSNIYFSGGGMPIHIMTQVILKGSV